ncbi:TPA: hypothetical protein ACP32N_005078 [Pseudomonas aeruginosa]
MREAFEAIWPDKKVHAQYDFELREENAAPSAAQQLADEERQASGRALAARLLRLIDSNPGKIDAELLALLNDQMPAT